MSATTAPNYSYEDLQCAGLVIACQYRTDRYGNPLYTAEFIAWAKDVFRAFARAAWALLRKGAQSLKAAWARLKAAGLKALQAVRYVAEGVTGAALRRGRTEGRDTTEVQAIRVKGTGAFQARTRERVDRVQTTLPAIRREAKVVAQLLSPSGAVQGTIYDLGGKVALVLAGALNAPTATFARVSEAKAYGQRYLLNGRWTA